MTQKIIKVGSSVAVVIPKDTVKKYNLTPGTPVTFRDTAEGRLVYTPQKQAAKIDPQQSKVAKITIDFIHRYRKDLEALKDK